MNYKFICFCWLVKAHAFLFACGTDSLFSINSRNDNLYIGIDNPVYLEKKFQNDSIYLFSTNNGMIFKTEDQLNVIPYKKPDAFVYVYKIINQDTLLCAEKRFFIEYVPEPCLLIDDQRIMDNIEINRESILNNPVLNIHISDDIINSGTWIKIKRFSMGYKSGNIYQSYDTFGDTFSGEMLEAIKRLKPGHQINLRVSVESSERLIKYLPVISFILY